jgi:SAM-dependent methyltransferase
MSERLIRYREVWRRKRVLREAYAQWYGDILADLSPVAGPTLEVGSGIGNFKEFKPDVVTSDIEKSSWVDMAFDAHSIPFESGSLGNIVMVDVLHHLSSPVAFLREAARALKKGGRLLIVEPYPSPVSLLVYRAFHPEPFIMDVDYFNKTDVREKDPWEANQAAAYLLFYRHRREFERVFSSSLRVIKSRRMSFVLYPLSGGFENRALAPGFLVPALKLIEAALRPLTRLLAFRCYVVLERV